MFKEDEKEEDPASKLRLPAEVNFMSDIISPCLTLYLKLEHIIIVLRRKPRKIRLLAQV